MLALLPTQTTYIPTEIINNPVIIQEEVKDPEQTYPGEGCNCYFFVRNRVENLPRMVAILPNSDPVIGGVAIEFFKGIKHVSVITKVEPGGVWVAESNYKHCETGERYIPHTKYSLVGFWSS